MNNFKNSLLYISIGLVTLIEFAVVGNYYNANNHSILLNLLMWTFLVLIAYFSLIFIPFFNKKKVKYIDGFALSSGFFAIILYCLAHSKSIDDYSYLSSVSFCAGIISTFETISVMNRKAQHFILEQKVDRKYIDIISSLNIETQKKIIILIKQFNTEQQFKLSEASIILNISENKTRKILKEAIKVGVINYLGNTSAKRYFITKI